MKAYVTIAYGNDDIAPYFIKHYTRIGVTEFVLLTYDDGNDSSVRHRFAEHAASCGARYTDGPHFTAEQFSHGHRQRAVKELVNGTHEWAVHADIDEFCECDDLVKLCHDSRVGLISGRWLDRLAEGAVPKKIDPSKKLDLQYPYAGMIRARMRLNDDCVVAAKDAPLSHHPRGSGLWRESIKLRVHHFKWQANVSSRLSLRHDGIADKDSPYARRVSRQLELLKRGIPNSWYGPTPKRLGL